MERILSDISPIFDVQHDCILSKGGDISIVLKLELPEIFSMSADNYETIHFGFVKAIKAMPRDSIFHKQDWFINTDYQCEFNSGPKGFLGIASDRFFNERPYLHHESYLILTKIAGWKRMSNSLFSSLIKTSIVPALSMSTTKLQDFEDACSQVIRILHDCGIFSKRLTDQDLLSSEKTAGLIERYLFLKADNTDLTIRDLEMKNHFKVGENNCELFTLADPANLPSLCSPRVGLEKYSGDKSKFPIGFATGLGLLLPCNHIYNQFVIINDSQSVLKKFESKRLRLQSLSAYSRENAIARDAVNDFLNECITEQRLPVKAHFNVLIWSDKPEELKDLRNVVSSALSQMDAVPKRETAGAPQIFWAAIPGNETDFPLNETFDTFAEQASCFLTMETNYRDSISATGIRLGERISGKPVHVDISDEPVKKGICTNRNKFILGPSGSGKSFFTNHMVRTYYEQGTHIVLVDVGHSYKGLCDLLGGYYFTYSESNPIKFNPFFIPKGDVLDTERKESIKTLLLALWKKDNETFNRSEYVALSDSLKLYYEMLVRRPDVFACFNSFYDFLRDEFVSILSTDKVKDKDFDVSNFLYVLRPYYAGGEFDYLLNATENLDLLNERFIVFELDNIKDHPILFPVVTIIIMEVFISKMRKLKGIRKMILIEEAWKAIAREGMAEYIKYLFKTVRKFYGEAVVVTQEVEDIISSPVVKQAIINNSDCKILLDQSKYQNKFDQIQELLGLTDKEKALVLSINKANDPQKKYKEVFISLGGILSKVYRTEVSVEEYLTYTTEETEKMKVQDYARRFGSVQKGISVMANEIRESLLTI
jgi:conjugation system TraG family ATPase